MISNVTTKKIIHQRKNLTRVIHRAYINHDDYLVRRIVKSKSVDLITEIVEASDDLKLIQFVLLSAVNSKIGAIFNALSLEVKKKIIECSHHGFLRLILDDMFSNDIVDLMHDLPNELEKKILVSASINVRNSINQLLHYPLDEAGRIMNPEFLVLRCSMSIFDAIQFVRDHREQYESYSTCYVVDDEFVLRGYIKFDALVFAQDYTVNVGDIMKTDVISISISENIDTISNVFEKYSLDRLAVVDENNYLSGVIYANDILPAMKEINEKQLFRMVGIVESNISYMHTSILKIVKSRIVWLLLLLLITTLTTFIIQEFTTNLGNQYLISLSTLLLVPLITAISGTCGNSGSQTSTSIIRAIALGEITKSEYGKVFGKEICVALVIGCSLAIFNFIRLAIFFAIPSFSPDVDKFSGLSENIKVSLVKNPYLLSLVGAAIGSFALFILVIFSKMLGALLPILATKCRIDPSVMASPLISTILDSVSSLILFGFGSLFLQLVLL